jgi:hypothetical protein
MSLGKKEEEENRQRFEKRLRNNSSVALRD